MSPQEVLEQFYAAERIYMTAGGVPAGASFEGMGATLHPDVQLHHSRICHGAVNGTGTRVSKAGRSR